MRHDRGDAPIGALPGGVTIAADDYLNPGGLSYQEALSELLGLNGRWIKVTILGLFPICAMAYFEGRLAAARDILDPTRAAEGEALRLTFDDVSSWLALEPRTFSHAGYVEIGSDRGVFAITQGITVIRFDARDHSD